ncbi:MAG: multifunctional tRNA nucleotidyl transferase/23-cyclic [Pseudomonadota bacterium]
MEVYLVGGAVRDELLGRPVTERDYVVTGATAEQLLRLGYRPVGRDFPVFLHPTDHSEYALARRERKSGAGYRGFITEFSPDIPLEEDLRRRDLTINAIARSASGELIDPWGGRSDLAERWLRHVSEAFAEDPVRILRVARFAARYAPLGFRVHPDTQALMRAMVESGEVAALVPERVWQETARALGEARPDLFFATLRDCGALQILFPEVDALFGVPQPAQWHPEIDTGRHVMACLQQAARHGAAADVAFALLVHDLGKALTPPGQWPRHLGHERAGLAPLHRLCDRLRPPAAWRELGALVCEHHTLVHRALELRASTVLDLLERCDALRRPARFESMLLACELDARGREGLEDRPYPQRGYLRRARETAAATVLTADERAGLAGPDIAALLRERRRAALRAWRNTSRAAQGITGAAGDPAG